MIVFKTGNILNEDAEALVNTVNCVGVMGRGIALQFKNTFPENYKEYADACKKGILQPGRMFIHEIDNLTSPKYIINFPTKRHWRGKSRIEDIESGLAALADEIKKRNIKSIAIPPLGSGLGGLNWSQVRQRIVDSLEQLDAVRIIVFEPSGAPEQKTISHITKVPNMTPGRAALVELINRYLAGLLDPFVTLIEIHKLLYFLQEAGEPLKLKYTKGHYGPYAENLRHVLRAIEGHLISGYADGGDNPKKQIELVPGAVEDARNFLQNHPETLKRFDQVSQLVDGFETPFGLELLSTAYWVITYCDNPTLETIISETHLWNASKKKFSPRQITLATKTLIHKGWISNIAIEDFA